MDNTKDGWMCQCESYRLGHKVCRHMMAAFILASLESRVSKRKTRLNSELPERWCRHCGHTTVTWSESRPLKRISAPKTESKGTSVNRYTCDACRRRFTDRPGFEGRHYSEDIILFTLRLIARNMLPGDAVDTIHEEKKVKMSSLTIQMRVWTITRGWWRRFTRTWR